MGTLFLLFFAPLVGLLLMGWGIVIAQAIGRFIGALFDDRY